MKLDTIYNEDCLGGMKRIPDGSIDMILCDLPYGTTRCSWDVVIPFEPLWEQYNKIIKDNGAIVLFAKEPFASNLRLSNLPMYRYDWIWEKTRGTGHLDANKRPMRYFENVCVFYKNQPTYNPIKTGGHTRKVSTVKHNRNCNTGEIYGKSDSFKDYDSTERYPKDILVFKSDRQKENYHPTQKPVALLEYLIKTYSNESETVLDNCMGSGSTAIACLNTNRRFIGFELNKEYFDIANKRINDEFIL